MSKTVNLIYNNNNGPVGPSGSTPRQGVAGVAAVAVYSIAQGIVATAPLPGNTVAASVIQSNGENIANVVFPNNPLPLGL
jgi:lipid-binding SYLF domain-containing protein